MRWQFYNLKDRIRYLHLAQAVGCHDRFAQWSVTALFWQEQRKSVSSASLQEELSLRLGAVHRPDYDKGHKFHKVFVPRPSACQQALLALLLEAEKLQQPLLQDCCPTCAKR